MSKIIDAIGRDKINNFTLSFKDSEMEKKFITEYTQNFNKIGIALNWIFLGAALVGGIYSLIIKDNMGLIILSIDAVTIILILLWLIFKQPSLRLLHISSVLFSFLWIWGSGYYFFYIAPQVFLISVALAIIGIIVYYNLLPTRFIYSMFMLNLCTFGYISMVFLSNRLYAYDFITVCMIIILLGILYSYFSYYNEAMKRINFYQRGVIADYSDFLKKMFGRYLSTEVMNTLIENPSALELGGEKREVTIMMTDLRGFVALTERLKPEKVVEMLNAYFEVMVDIVLKYNGTINEIIGDALMVFFGAPQEMPDRAERAIACAIDMQNAMAHVNSENRNNGLPELEMGIGINEAEVVVGNIGSSKRSKYTVVGSGVNLTSRIESYTVGGQILISESVKNKVGDKIRIDNQLEVMPKGSDSALKLFETGGISGDYNLTLMEKDFDMVMLTQQIPFQYKIIDGKHVGKSGLKAVIKKLSKVGAEITSDEALERLSNLKINLEDTDDILSSKDLYAKIIETTDHSYILRFTSVPAEIAAYFIAFRRHRLIGGGL